MRFVSEYCGELLDGWNLRWHVRTKENIARVRKDEAEAAEKERQELLRIEAADKEARLNVLKQKRKQQITETEVDIVTHHNHNKEHTEHINLFSNLGHAIQTTNQEHDKEIKEKTEGYEKKIGYLTYLGQDTNEALGKKNWYELPPESSRFSRSDKVKETYEKLVLRDDDGKPKKNKVDEKDGEVGWKSKQRHDPIHIFKIKSKSRSESYMQESINNDKHKKKIKSRKHEHNKDDAKTKLNKLREARLKREQQEKYKTELFLKKLSGVVEEKKEEEPKQITPKYNSQFNPEFARQNYR